MTSWWSVPLQHVTAVYSVTASPSLWCNTGFSGLGELTLLPPLSSISTQHIGWLRFHFTHFNSFWHKMAQMCAYTVYVIYIYIQYIQYVYCMYTVCIYIYSIYSSLTLVGDQLSVSMLRLSPECRQDEYFSEYYYLFWILVLTSVGLYRILSTLHSQHHTSKSCLVILFKTAVCAQCHIKY